MLADCCIKHPPVPPSPHPASPTEAECTSAQPTQTEPALSLTATIDLTVIINFVLHQVT